MDGAAEFDGEVLMGYGFIFYEGWVGWFGEYWDDDVTRGWGASVWFWDIPLDEQHGHFGVACNGDGIIQNCASSVCLYCGQLWSMLVGVLATIS